MITLFIDTSQNDIIVGIVKDKTLVSAVYKNSQNTHSIYATSLVKKVIDDAKIDANDVENIMVVNGPGSFTGLRIGVTIAKTYGYLIKRNITPVSSLKSLAISYDKDSDVITILRANKTSYYVGIYDKEYNEIITPEFMNKDKLIEVISKYNLPIISNDLDIINSNKVEKITLDIPKIVSYYYDKEKVNYHAIVPNYMKEPQAIEDKK